MADKGRSRGPEVESEREGGFKMPPRKRQRVSSAPWNGELRASSAPWMGARASASEPLSAAAVDAAADPPTPSSSSRGING